MGREYCPAEFPQMCMSFTAILTRAADVCFRIQSCVDSLTNDIPYRCEKCTGASTYSEKKAECDARNGATTTTRTSTTPTASSSSSASATTTTSAPKETTTNAPTTDKSSGTRVASILGLWIGDVGYVLSGSLFGIAAVLAGIL